MQPNNKRSSRRNINSRKQVVTQVSAIVRADKLIHPQPPTFVSSHHYVQRFRFVSTNAVVSYPINSADIANLLGVVASVDGDTHTVGEYGVYTRFRIKSLEMWCTTSSLAVPSTLIASYQNSAGDAANTEQTVTDTTASIDEYAYVKLVPKWTSPASQYQSAVTTGGTLRLDCPAGTILDLVLHVWLSNNDPVTVFDVFNRNTSIAVGDVVVNPLDPSSTGISFFIPQGYLTPSSTASSPTPRP